MTTTPRCRFHDLPLTPDGKCPLGREGGYALHDHTTKRRWMSETTGKPQHRETTTTPPYRAPDQFTRRTQDAPEARDMMFDHGDVTYRGTVLGRIEHVSETPDGIAVMWRPNAACREWLDRVRGGVSEDTAVEARTMDELRHGFAALHADDIDHPAHYGGAGDPFEPIKIIEAKDLGFHVGNALKYMMRAGHKPGESMAKDLRKAVWYLNRRIEQLDREAPETVADGDVS